MSTLIFDPRKHLTHSDVLRLKEQAAAAGLSEDDYIERHVKQALWSTVVPLSSPVKRRRAPVPPPKSTK